MFYFRAMAIALPVGVGLLFFAVGTKYLLRTPIDLRESVSSQSVFCMLMQQLQFREPARLSRPLAEPVWSRFAICNETL